jgi:putative ABC transport system permease protein
MLTDRIYEDLRSAIRLIARNRTLSFAVFVSLALGIGASTSAFAVFNYLLFQRLPIPETDRVVRITSTNPASPLDQVSYPDFDDLRKRATVFDAVATSEPDGFTVDAHGGGQPRMTIGMITSGDFFKVMRLQPVLGRAFGPDEDAVPDRSARGRHQQRPVAARIRRKVRRAWKDTPGELHRIHHCWSDA